MICLGFNFHKGVIRIAVLKLTDDEIHYVNHDVITVDDTLPLPDLMNRYKQEFKALIAKYKPTIIAVRNIFESSNRNQAKCQIMPIGILASLPDSSTTHNLVDFTDAALRANKKFGLKKEDNITDEINRKFGNHPPHWKQAERSILVAWRALIEHTDT